MAKTLFFLNAEKPINRVIRRGVTIGFFTFVSFVIQQIIEGELGFKVPDIYVPILTAVLAMIDKANRKKKKPPFSG